ncbi:MAG: gas vesicle protein K [Candidatus Desantisbacteria bacterium]
MDKASVVITVKNPEEAEGSERINIDPENVEKGLAKLVLTLVELIRKLLEKQAIRRVEGGSLTDDEIERVGEALMKLEDKMQELKGIFGLKDEELNLNLGPLGDLM